MRHLDNPIRRYAWGSTDAIPALLGVPPDGGPQAELWIGAHERAGSSIDGVPLLDIAAAEPARVLGPRWAAGRRLPFLAKVVSVAEPLSLQVHPSARLAAEWCAAEEAGGIGRDDPRRSCPDDVAKIEMVYAVSAFEALCGFRPLPDLLGFLDHLDLPALMATSAALRAGGAAALRTESERLLTAVEPAGVADGLRERAGTPGDGGRWDTAVRLLADVARRYPRDPAVSLAVLLQPHLLAPGEALLIPPGQPHTYLSGTAVEVQANSDNVVRAGLTEKHVDVPLLLRALDTDAGAVAAIGGELDAAEQVFAADTDRFRLSVLEDGPAKLAAMPEPQVFCCLDGRFELADDEGPLTLTRGRTAFAGADAGDVLVCGRGRLVRVTPGRAG